MRVPTHETSQFAFYILRVGSTLVRKCDNTSVYFQPGDDSARAESNAGHCFACPDMVPGEGNRVFNRWASQYF